MALWVHINETYKTCTVARTPVSSYQTLLVGSFFAMLPCHTTLDYSCYFSDEIHKLLEYTDFLEVN